MTCHPNRADLPYLSLLTIAGMAYLLAHPSGISLLLPVAAIVSLLVMRLRLERWPRRAVVLATALIVTGLGLTVLTYTDGKLLAMLLGVAGWLKLAEDDRPRDRFVAAIAGVWQLAFILPNLPPNLQLLAVAGALICLVWALFRDMGLSASHLTRFAWTATVAPALVLATVLFLFTPRVTGNLGMLAFVFKLPFVIETEAEANRTPPKAKQSLEEFREEDSEEIRVLTADFTVASGPFEKRAPPVSELYWRGPVYWIYENGTWQVRPGAERRANRMRDKLTGEKLDAQMREATRFSMYDVTVFPHRGEWLYALDIPAFTPPSTYITQDWQLMNLNKVHDLLTYKMLSTVEYRAGITPDDETRALGLQLPDGEEPRTQALGRSLREIYGDDPVEIARQGRAIFNDSFSYDPAAPAPEGANPVDQFLFETQDGIGMQYATAYALMMRAAGIPARVVSGYQGGIYMFLVERVFVTQRDSHAWVEIWLDDYGWVRMDVARTARGQNEPSSNVSAIAEPVESELPQGESKAETAPDPQQTGSENTKTAAHWLMQFGADTQSKWLEARGLSARPATLLLIGVAILATISYVWIGALLLRHLWRLQRTPALLRLTQKFCQKLAKTGTKRRRNEGLRAYTERVLSTGDHSEAEANDIRRAADWLCHALYLGKTTPAPTAILSLRGAHRILNNMSQLN